MENIGHMIDFMTSKGITLLLLNFDSWNWLQQTQTIRLKFLLRGDVLVTEVGCGEKTTILFRNLVFSHQGISHLLVLEKSVRKF